MKQFKSIGVFLREALSLLGKLFGSIFLIVLALVLFVPVFIAAVIWKIIVTVKHENRKARDIISGTAQFFKAIAIAYDQLGNVAFGGFFNWLFIVNSEKFPFGETHETVSEVLGWNQVTENLTRSGKLMVAILHLLERDHCVKALTAGFYAAQYKVEMFKKLEPQIRTIEEHKAFMEKYK